MSREYSFLVRANLTIWASLAKAIHGDSRTEGAADWGSAVIDTRTGEIVYEPGPLKAMCPEVEQAPVAKVRLKKKVSLKKKVRLKKDELEQHVRDMFPGCQVVQFDRKHAFVR